MTRPARAYVVEQNPHPMFPSPAPFVAVVFPDGFLKWDRRRLKRETARAMKAWRRARDADLPKIRPAQSPDVK